MVLNLGRIYYNAGTSDMEGGAQVSVFEKINTGGSDVDNSQNSTKEIPFLHFYYLIMKLLCIF